MQVCGTSGGLFSGPLFWPSAGVLHMSQKESKISQSLPVVGMHSHVGGSNRHWEHYSDISLFAETCWCAVEVPCFVGIQGYSQGADLTAGGWWRGCAVYTWVIATILPYQTPTVTHQWFPTMIDLFSWKRPQVINKVLRWFGTLFQLTWILGSFITSVSLSVINGPVFAIWVLL